MSLPRTVADVIASHVTLELESLDRVYLNVYQPKLQTPRAVFYFLREHFGEGAVSSHQMKAITERFLDSIDDYAIEHEVPVISFEKGQRKEDVAAKYLAAFSGTEGVLFIGKAQEKVRTFRTEGRRNQRGETYPWIIDSTAMVNQYYFYAVDQDFGPFFLKYSSYFPYGAKLCFNGHEYLKRQLAKEGIGYEELANGILSCDNSQRMQALANGLTPNRIERFLRKWQDRLPCPFTNAPTGRWLPLRGVNVPGRVCPHAGHGSARPWPNLLRGSAARKSRPRAARQSATDLRTSCDQANTGVVPYPRCPRGRDPVAPFGLQIQPHQAVLQGGPRLAHELTVHNPRDFGLGRSLANLPALRELGFQTNRRVLRVQTTSQDFAMSEQLFREVTGPCRVQDQRASALRFGDPTAQALFSVMVLFRLLPCWISQS